MAAPSHGARRRFTQKVNQVQEQPTVITPSAQFLGAAMPLVPGNIYGRMGKGPVSGRRMVNAPVVGLAAGNSVVTTDPRGGRPGYRKTGGTNTSTFYDESPANLSPWPHAQVFTPGSLDSAGAHARTDAFQHGHLIAHDRHIIQNQGRVTSSAVNQRTGANPNPEADGPPKRTWKMFNRTISHMYGADDTAFLDNGQYHASVIVPGRNRKFPLATQGQEWSIRYGGTPGLASFRPYGTRGGFSAGAPQPTVRADPGGPFKFGTLLQVGAPNDGPQKVYGGLPWGLHSPTLNTRQGMQSLIRSRIGQVKPVWNVRPQNSKTAGQSWSQSMVSLSGQQAVKLKATAPIRQPGMNSRWLGN
jgi:hypothetical protein